MEAESVYCDLLKNYRGRIKLMLKCVKCNKLVEFTEISHMHASAQMAGSSDAHFCSCLAPAWPPARSEARQSPRWSQAERKFPRQASCFHNSPAAFQSSLLMLQKWCPRVNKEKGKEWSLQGGLQHLYLRMCLATLFFSPLQSISY